MKIKYLKQIYYNHIYFIFFSTASQVGGQRNVSRKVCGLKQDRFGKLSCEVIERTEEKFCVEKCEKNSVGNCEVVPGPREMASSFRGACEILRDVFDKPVCSLERKFSMSSMTNANCGLQLD